MKLTFDPSYSHAESDIKFVIIISYVPKANKWVFVRRHFSKSWELPAGHKEKGENSIQAARRELVEETGAKRYTIEVLTDYTLLENSKEAFGRIFLANIFDLGPLAEFEIEERILADKIPLPHSYPYLQEKMLAYAKYKLRKD